ncbi:hypothetical protein [Streptomyces lanatus]|uniref:Integral membrane protein n=1 Tax=Streptomyces lanatus TaxID=66900 RepID=A0ABV1Y1D2_9ACTN|nr:hypothetical protein [Streptomyces lanatus]GHH24696.1 hypothetical protein GCM10018780_75470 [Streptomyces lanatus]
MITLLALLACALALYLLAQPRIPRGIKVLVLTAPPVAAVIWLLEAVLDESSAAVAVAAVFVVVLLALIGLLGHPRLPLWSKMTVFATVPATALAWLLVVTADDALKDPGEDPCSMYYGGVGVSKAFPPQAYCRYDSGGTHDLATGAQFVFWVCFVTSVLLLSIGLWQVARDPRALVRQFRTLPQGPPP